MDSTRGAGCGAAAVFSIAASILFTGCTSLAQTDITSSWYPPQPGNTWANEKEALDGDIAKPDLERWTTEETITAALPFPELAGSLITKNQDPYRYHDGRFYPGK